MLSQTVLYDLIYALAARDGREAALFGSCSPLAHEAFEHSTAAGDIFPELWFEIPLAGNPWFDLHALTACEDLRPNMTFEPSKCGGYPEVFDWFATQERTVRQLALSWDVSSGNIEHPAIQLLVTTRDPEVTCAFLKTAGRPDAASPYRSFIEGLPEGWFACYSGVFPARPGHNLRVECIPNESLQRAYAQDANLLEAHLLQTGLDKVGDTLVPRCQELSRTPFRIEFQFDVRPDGRADTTVGVSLRFAPPPGETDWDAFDPNAAGGSLMRLAQSWELVDDRWKLLADTAFAQRVTLGSQSSLLYCFPAFLKLRWRDGEPLDAKAYLMAGVQ